MLEKIRQILKHLNLLSLSIPAAILVAGVVLPLQPLVRQALVGVILVWFGAEAMGGFPFWKE